MSVRCGTDGVVQQKAKEGAGAIAAQGLEDVDDSGGSAQVTDVMQILRNSLGAKAAPATAAKASSPKRTTRPGRRP